MTKNRKESVFVRYGKDTRVQSREFTIQLQYMIEVRGKANLQVTGEDGSSKTFVATVPFTDTGNIESDLAEAIQDSEGVENGVQKHVMKPLLDELGVTDTLLSTIIDSALVKVNVAEKDLKVYGPFKGDVRIHGKTYTLQVEDA